jgi:hypothetical protein
VSCPGQDTLGATTIPDFLPGNSGDIYNVSYPRISSGKPSVSSDCINNTGPTGISDRACSQ